MTTQLDYISGSTIIPENAFAISPSRIHSFFEKPHEWYRENVLGEEGFQGSTSSVLGTIVHYAAECFNKGEPFDKEEVTKYLLKTLAVNYEQGLGSPAEMLSYIENNPARPDIDLYRIQEQYPVMASVLVSDLRVRGKATESEKMVAAQVIPGYYVCGSIDDIHGTTITDYKTTSDLSPKEYIPYNYKLQLLCYAWACRKNGIPIDRISIKWVTNNIVGRVSEKTGKPMKDYPSQVVTVTQTITEEDYAFIDDILKLVAESVKYCKDNPEAAYLVFKDYRLKQQVKTKLTLFKGR